MTFDDAKAIVYGACDEVDLVNEVKRLRAENDKLRLKLERVAVELIHLSRQPIPSVLRIRELADSI